MASVKEATERCFRAGMQGTDRAIVAEAAFAMQQAWRRTFPPDRGRRGY
jgi:hypothetical protein